VFAVNNRRKRANNIIRIEDDRIDRRVSDNREEFLELIISLRNIRG